MDETYRKRRMAQDKAMIQSPHKWPDFVLHMKTQPWVEKREFGTIEETDLLAVHIKDGMETRHYPSLDSLVSVWSVD